VLIAQPMMSATGAQSYNNYTWIGYVPVVQIRVA
jgi:hypothetical protein